MIRGRCAFSPPHPAANAIEGAIREPLKRTECTLMDTWEDIYSWAEWFEGQLKLHLNSTDHPGRGGSRHRREDLSCPLRSPLPPRFRSRCSSRCCPARPCPAPRCCRPPAGSGSSSPRCRPRCPGCGASCRNPVVAIAEVGDLPAFLSARLPGCRTCDNIITRFPDMSQEPMLTMKEVFRSCLTWWRSSRWG